MRIVITDEIIVKRYASTRASADSRGLEFNMSLKRIKQLLSTKRCYFTGVELTNKAGDNNQLTFDRLDNTKGYTDANVVACSHKINQLKKNLTIKEIEMLYKGITKKQKHGIRGNKT